MIEFLRGKREAEKAQRQAHRTQREELVASFDELQLDVLEEERGGARAWAESGPGK